MEKIFANINKISEKYEFTDIVVVVVVRWSQFFSSDFNIFPIEN